MGEGEGEGSSSRFILTHTLKFQRPTTSTKNRRVDQWVGLRENDKPKFAYQRAHGEKRGDRRGKEIQTTADFAALLSPEGEYGQATVNLTEHEHDYRRCCAPLTQSRLLAYRDIRSKIITQDIIECKSHALGLELTLITKVTISAMTEGRQRIRRTIVEILRTILTMGRVPRPG